MPEKQIGRPAIPEGKRRSELVQARVTPSERKSLEKHVKRFGGVSPAVQAMIAWCLKNPRAGWRDA